MESYYFILGRENKISQTELECVLASFDFGFRSEANVPRSPEGEVGSSPISILSDQVLEIKLSAAIKEIKKLIDILGGTVKIYQKIALTNEKIETLLSKEDKASKLIFAISNYSSAKVDTFRMALAAKKAVKKSTRIIDGKEGGKLSSAQSFQHKMDIDNVEYGLFETGIGKLIAVQDINEWTRHDYGKPKSDAKSGMLPPKLARIMVNLAVGESGIKKPLVCDPFCGSGNVSIEAISVGCDVIGSDISEKAVADTKENVKWFAPDSDFPITHQDATKIDFSTIEREFVIVTEPFLGQPRTSKLRIEEEKQAKDEIVKLYKDFFRNLKLTGLRLKTICLVFPLFELANGKKLSIFEDCVDFIHEIGYTTVCPPLDYGRDYQVVKRQIVLLKRS